MFLARHICENRIRTVFAPALGLKRRWPDSEQNEPTGSKALCTVYSGGKNVSPHHRQSNCRGVRLSKSGKWLAKIKVNGKIEHLGTFEDEEDAARAFDRRAIELGRPPNFAHTKLGQPCSEEDDDEVEDEGEDRLAQCKQSKYRGVSWTRSGKWFARIWVDGKFEHLGTF